MRPKALWVGLISLGFLWVVAGRGVRAQEAGEPPVVVPGPLPSPQERLLAPVPEPFTWMAREVPPNPPLETLLRLRRDIGRLFLAVSLAEDYSDNFFQRPDNPQEEFRTLASLNTVYRLQRERGFLSLANTLSALYEARAEEGRVAFANFALIAGYQLPRLSLALSDSFVRDDDPQVASLAGLRRERRTFIRNRLSPQLRVALSRLTEVTLGYTNTLVINETETRGPLAPLFATREDDNTVGHAVSAGLTHRFSRRLEGDFRYGFDLTDSEGATDSQGHDVSLSLHYRAGRRTILTGRAFGALTERSRGGQDARRYGADLGLRQQLTPFLALFVSAGATVLEQEGEDPEVFLNWQVDLDGALPLLRARQTTLTLTGRQSLTDTVAEVDNVGLVLQRSLTLTLNHAASRRLLASLFASLARTELLEAFGTSEAVPDREDTVWRAGANVSYALLRAVSLSLSYAYQRRDSNVAGADFDENRVTLSLTAGLPVF
ncbi:MAG: hypothetical protein KatS3mg131_3764 [Candidatus Tectimicrobiota bacterium]|nr:MAG: hypothetical protein KatS3mg131_3764 [Candidatus Tectomicrobia bacterium]